MASQSPPQSLDSGEIKSSARDLRRLLDASNRTRNAQETSRKVHGDMQRMNRTQQSMNDLRQVGVIRCGGFLSCPSSMVTTGDSENGQGNER